MALEERSHKMKLENKNIDNAHVLNMTLLRSFQPSTPIYPSMMLNGAHCLQPLQSIEPQQHQPTAISQFPLQQPSQPNTATLAMSSNFPTIASFPRPNSSRKFRHSAPSANYSSITTSTRDEYELHSLQ
jgi:hypothetical protein